MSMPDVLAGSNPIFSSGVLMMFEHGNPQRNVSRNHNGTQTSSHSAPQAETSVLAELLLNPALNAKRMNVPAGKVLYEPGAEAKALYFIHRGQVRTYRMDENANGRLIEILGPDDWCGEAALSRQPLYGEKATAVAATVVTEVPADRLLQVLSQQPKAAVELMKQLAGKLSASRADAAGLVFEDCHERLLKTLVRFSHSAAATPHAEGVVLRTTHRRVGQTTGRARETGS